MRRGLVAFPQARIPGAIARGVLFALILMGTIFLFGWLTAFIAPSLSAMEMHLYVSPVATLLAAVLAHFVLLRAFDRRPWSAVGLGRASARPWLLGEGFILGACAIGIPSVLLLAMAQLEVIDSAPGSSLSVAALGVVTFLPAAFFEELLMRGYLFMVIREAFGWKAALIVTSIVFGLLHMLNPNVDAESVLLVTVAGFFLGAILLATGSLFAVGMAHFGWNWIMAAALHTNVSGVPVPSPDFRVVDNGPDWLTGGAWGPEGGLAAGFGMITVFTYLYARRIHRMES